MKKESKKTLAVLLAIIIPILVIAGLIGAWFASMIIFPDFYGISDKGQFTVINTSGEVIYVTPIGMCRGSGEYGPLCSYAHNEALMKKKLDIKETSDIRIPSEGSYTFDYDWHDTNFRYILVRNEEGIVYILDTDKRGTLQTTYPPQQKSYAIPPLAALDIAPQELLPCIEGEFIYYTAAKEYPETPST